MDSRKQSMSNVENIPVPRKEWDEASCPICMDHPHNAVLLICTSHDKGCRSYICDTSYRHSNCLDRFKKLKEENNTDSFGEIDSNTLQCPLCRGTVLGMKVLEDARKYLNLKPRACSRESCSFSGNYQELRGHARRVHPTARPADIDPGRQRAWRRLENRREYDDIVSAIHTAVPGSVVVGDYMIEGGRDRVGLGEREGGARWMSTLVLFQMIGSLDSRGGEERRGGRRSRGRGGGGVVGDGGVRRRRRYLWGENLLGLQDEDEDEEEEGEEIRADEVDLNVPSDIGPPPRRRRRRRLMQARRDDEDRQ